MKKILMILMATVVVLGFGTMASADEISDGLPSPPNSGAGWHGHKVSSNSAYDAFVLENSSDYFYFDGNNLVATGATKWWRWNSVTLVWEHGSPYGALSTLRTKDFINTSIMYGTKNVYTDSTKSTVFFQVPAPKLTPVTKVEELLPNLTSQVGLMLLWVLLPILAVMLGVLYLPRLLRWFSR